MKNAQRASAAGHKTTQRRRRPPVRRRTALRRRTFLFVEREADADWRTGGWNGRWRSIAGDLTLPPRIAEMSCIRSSETVCLFSERSGEGRLQQRIQRSPIRPSVVQQLGRL